MVCRALKRQRPLLAAFAVLTGEPGPAGACRRASILKGGPHRCADRFGRCASPPRSPARRLRSAAFRRRRNSSIRSRRCLVRRRRSRFSRLTPRMRRAEGAALSGGNDLPAANLTVCLRLSEVIILLNQYDSETTSQDDLIRRITSFSCIYDCVQFNYSRML